MNQMVRVMSIILKKTPTGPNSYFFSGYNERVWMEFWNCRYYDEVLLYAKRD